MSEENKTQENNKVIPLFRALEEAFEYDEKSYDFTVQGEPGQGHNEVWSEEVKAFLDSWTLKSLFFTEDWVYITVDLAASKLSAQPLKVMTKRIINGKTILEPNDAHPLNALIAEPNPWQDYHAWCYTLFEEYFLGGNSIMWYARGNKHLVNLGFERVSLDFDPGGQINNYLFTAIPEENPAAIKKDNMMNFKPEDIIHIRRPNPNSLLWGLSPFVPGRKSILFNRYSSDYLNSFYTKGAVPGMAIEMDRSVNESVALRQLRSFELAYQGRKNMRRTLILPKGVKATPVSHNISDQKLPDLVNMNRETILALLKVPKHEVGLQTAGSLGSEEHRVALRNFWEATLIPAAEMVSGGLTKFFAKQLGENNILMFDLSNVEALKDDMMKKALLAKEMLAAGLSVNEVRQRVWEVNTFISEDADVPFVIKPPQQIALPPFPQIPRNEEEPESVEEIEDEPATETTESDEAVDNSVDNTEEKEAKPLETEEPKTLKADSLRSTISKRSAGWLISMEKAISDVAESTQRIRPALELSLETLTAMAEVVEPIIKRMLSEKASIPSRVRLRKAIEKAFGEFEEEWVDAFIRVLRANIDLGYDQMLGLIFNEQDKRKIEALKARGANKRRLILEERGIESFSQISKTHTERIMSQIVKGAEANETIQQIARRISATFAEPEEMLSKAMMIARTETLTAMSIGQAAAMNDAKSVIPDMKKAWLSANDDRVRDSHAEVNGEVVGVNEKFSNGLAYPREPGAPAGEVIQCRCSLVLLPPGEDLEP